GRVLAAPRAADPLLPPLGRPPGASRGVARLLAVRRSASARLWRAARAGETDAQGSRMGADRQPTPGACRAHRARRREPGRGGRSSRSRGRPHPREASLAPLAQARGRSRGGGSLMRRERHAGLLFAAPALFLIVTCFFLPVAAGLLLSITDFDI